LEQLRKSLSLIGSNTHLDQHLHDSIFDGGDAEWTHLPVRFWDLDTTDRNWAKTLLSKLLLNFPDKGNVCFW
jgi:hypothetical protein